MRSRYPEQVGKSPTELMMVQAHPHWLWNCWGLSHRLTKAGFVLIL